MTINYSSESSIDEKLNVETDFPSPTISSAVRKKSRRSHSHRSSLKRQSTRRKSYLSDSIIVRNVYEIEPPPTPAVVQRPVDSILFSSLPENQRRTSLWREVKTFKGTCSTRMELVVSVTKAVVKDAGYLLLTIAISLCLVIIGSIYIAECPKCKFVPVYLLILGIFASINQTFSYRIHRQTTDFLEDHSKNLIGLRITFIILSFTVGTGTYWICKIYKPNWDPREGEYCNKFIYVFASFVTIMIYTLVLVVPFLWYVYKGIRDWIKGDRGISSNGSVENI